MFLLSWFSTEHWQVLWEVTTDIYFFPNLDSNNPKPRKPLRQAGIPIGGMVSDWFGSVLFHTKANWSSRVLFRLVGDPLSLRPTGWVESCREPNILDSTSRPFITASVVLVVNPCVISSWSLFRAVAGFLLQVRPGSDDRSDTSRSTSASKQSLLAPFISNFQVVHYFTVNLTSP